MNDLEKLLDRAFENRSGKNRYSSGKYEIAFEKRTWETLFWIYENRIPVVEGNIFDKEICFIDRNIDTQKYVSAIQNVLSDYDFHTSRENTEYVSVWDNAIVTSLCQMQLNDGKIINMEENDFEGDEGELEILEEEYVVLNGVKFPVKEKEGRSFVSFEENSKDKGLAHIQSLGTRSQKDSNDKEKKQDLER